MEVTCTNCNHTTQLDVNFDVKIYACTNCVYVYQERDGLRFKDQLRPYTFTDQFEIGQVGVFNNTDYTITGILVKENEGFEWTEYILQGKENFLYLSEADGHWIILEEIEFASKVGNHPLTVDYEELTFDRYDYFYPKLIAARGFFDFDIFEKAELIEYINPPQVLSFERNGSEQNSFLGKHISKAAIKKAFKASYLPTKVGVGMVQPFLFNLRNLAITLCCVLALILVSNWYLNKERVRTEVLDTQLALANFTSKDFVSPSFTLTGSAAPLKVQLYAPVSNSWVNVQVALINEKTGEEVYASKDIEHYSGYTDGESWSEGSNSEEFNLCGIPAGTYHLNITPMKAPEDVNSDFMNVKVVWSEPSSRNIWLILIIMVVFVLVLYYVEKNFEAKRWGETNESFFNS